MITFIVVLFFSSKSPTSPISYDKGFNTEESWIDIAYEHYLSNKLKLDTSSTNPLEYYKSHLLLSIFNYHNKKQDISCYHYSKISKVNKDTIDYYKLIPTSLQVTIKQLNDYNLIHSIDSIKSILSEKCKSKINNLHKIVKNQVDSKTENKVPRKIKTYPNKMSFVNNNHLKEPKINYSSNGVGDIDDWALTIKDIKKAERILFVLKESLNFYEEVIHTRFVSMTKTSLMINGLKNKHTIKTNRKGIRLEDLEVTIIYLEKIEKVFTKNSNSEKVIKAYIENIIDYGGLNEVDFENIPYELTIDIRLPFDKDYLYNGTLGKNINLKRDTNEEMEIKKQDYLSPQELGALIGYQFVKGFEEHRLSIVRYNVNIKEGQSIEISSTLNMKGYFLKDYYKYQEENKITMLKIEALEKRLEDLEKGN